MLAKAAVKHLEKYPCFNKFSLLPVDNVPDVSDSDSDSDSDGPPKSQPISREPRAPVS